MLRAFLVSIVLLAAAAMPAMADPTLGSDLDSCRDRQTDVKLRQAACENLLSAGQLTGKDLATALAMRGNTLFIKRETDKAIEAYSAAHDADPDNLGILNSRGWAYERKGQDDLALADYNLALQKRPNMALVYNNRGTIYLRKGALQSALDDFNAALRLAPNMYYAHANRGRVETMNRDFDAALADFPGVFAEDKRFAFAVGRRCRAVN